MPDGGRWAAGGFLYQYVRTIEALLDLADHDFDGAVYIEGKPGGSDDGSPAESIDYELVNAAGDTTAAVQVKKRGPGGFMGPGEIFRILCGLVRDRDAVRYALVTNATLGDSAATLVRMLHSKTQPEELRERIGDVLSDARAYRALAQLECLDEETFARLSRAEVEHDPREDTEVRAVVRARLRQYRLAHRKGLGDASAGLMAGYLISEILLRAADESRARFTVAELHSKLQIDSRALRAAVSRRDWGVIVGPVPGWPDIHRGDLIRQIADELPDPGDGISVQRCVLAGLSGIGKSSLAAAFIMDQADAYDVIFWIDAESDAALMTSFTRVLSYMAGADQAGVAIPAELRARVHDALASAPGRWLMVLDNCVDLRAAEAWIPRSGDGHVIVTCTDEAAPLNAGTRIAVGPMTESEAIALLTARLPDHQADQPPTEQLPHLARALECWPLALELAAAYLETGGMGIRGIPHYLATLKMRSLAHSRSIPLGYPRTLVEAIFLCLERIEGQSGRPDDPPGVAATALWFAAYLSSRRIPAHLLVSAVLLDPETAGGFQATTPAYLSPAVFPTSEVVSILRSESLVNLDEPLSSAGLSDSLVPDVTVSVNSVLQEVLRHRRDTDLRMPELLGTLAYHVALWLTAAHSCADYEKTLIFAAHAAAIDEHAARLKTDSDFVAFMRGNLAPVLQRRGDNEQAARLLRAEIAYLAGKSADHCVMLCRQAQIMLASAIAEEEPPDYGEILRLLSSAYLFLQALAPEAPTRVAELALGIQATLRHVIPQRWGPDGELIRDLIRLETVVTDLLAHLPETPTAGVRGHEKVPTGGRV